VSSPRVLAASNIKAELRQKFPGVSFSVKSRTFANGTSVDVAWENGPTAEAVETVTGKYEEGTFNGNTDSYEYDRDPQHEEFRRIRGSAKYVMLRRGRG
jgi:hypothetical protein